RLRLAGWPAGPPSRDLRSGWGRGQETRAERRLARSFDSLLRPECWGRYRQTFGRAGGGVRRPASRVRSRRAGPGQDVRDQSVSQIVAGLEGLGLGAGPDQVERVPALTQRLEVVGDGQVGAVDAAGTLGAADELLRTGARQE